MSDVTIDVLLAALVVLPAMTAFALGIRLWIGRPRHERSFARATCLTCAALVAAALVLLAEVLARGEPHILELGNWFTIGNYTFEWTLVAGSLSLPFALFSAALVGLIGAFSRRYLHKEPGYFRFYFLLALFCAGVELVVLAGSLDLLFIGWETVGLSSALLIAFFHERREPVDNALRTLLTYRACDIGLLAAAVWIHHAGGSLQMTPDAGLAFLGFTVPETLSATAVGLLLLWAVIGKSAQLPVGGWLPRAMEGPTPSSAIFYGAISIHLGPYLLLRAAPILESSHIFAGAVIAVGALTALHATFVGRVQTDIKSALAYASMTQVGIIFVEIGCGWRYLALAHIVGHAALRSLQILRSPNLLHDHHHLEQAMARELPRTGAHLERLIPRAFQPWLYRHALERGYFDDLLRFGVVGGFTWLLTRIDRLDRAWVAFVSGKRREVQS